MLNAFFYGMIADPEYAMLLVSTLLRNLGAIRHKYLPPRFKALAKKYLSFTLAGPFNPKKPPKLSSPKSPKHTSVAKHSSTKLARLAVISALLRLHALPHFHSGPDVQLHQQLCCHVNPFGHLDTRNLENLPLFDNVLEYREKELHPKFDLIPGIISFIMDSGCGCSCSPFEEDFEFLQDLPKPVTLQGVTGDQTCTKGGMIRLQCLNDKGEIVVIRTSAYFNPHQKVRLFSPQCHFM